MEEKSILETEVLESTPNIIPEELKVYLEKDEEVLNKLDGVISGLEEDIVNLNNEKEESEKDFEARLEEFKEQLSREKEEAFNNFAKREQDILEHKSDIEKLKLDQQGKQVNYIESLNKISSEYKSKISSIEEAIKACEDNDTLTKALEEETQKMNNSLEDAYDARKGELSDVLKTIGEEEPVVEETPSYEEPTYEEENDIPSIELDVPDVSIPEVTPSFDTPIDNSLNIYEEEYDTEVVSHEPRKDVINVIYESEDVMEGHVFPFLRSLV